MAEDVTSVRRQLRASGFAPIPLFGKAPPIYGKNNNRKGLRAWQELHEVTPEQIDMWARTWPDACNTGVLTRLTPTIDLDILNEGAVRTIETHVREHHEERGHILVRIGKPPKRAIPFRTIEPFEKILANVVAPNGSAEKIEFLGDGQQVVVAGIHPDTGQPYSWVGGEPGGIKLEELPYIREAEAQQLVDEIVEILVRDFGYERATERPKYQRKSNGAAREANDSGGAADWQHLIDSILTGQSLHDSLRDLAAKMVKAGMKAGAVVNQLPALMNRSDAARDDRWKARFADIPRLVESAEALTKAPDPNVTPCKIDHTLAVFQRWLLLKDYTPVLAVLGAIAANYLEGDPVWLGLIGPPSSAKTEILNALSKLPHVVQAATVIPSCGDIDSLAPPSACSQARISHWTSVRFCNGCP